MPIPTPKDGEKKDDYVSRCIEFVLSEPEAGNKEQAAAICYDKWKEGKQDNTAHEMRFTCNVITSVRTEKWEGRDWLVAPVVALKAGVLNGELVVEEEVLKHPESWNGRPVVVYHPISKEGRPISANSPEVLSRQQVGQLFNVTASREDGVALKGEIWVDIAKAASLGGQAMATVQRLRSNKPLEVSTAYYRDMLMRDGELGGKPYKSVAKNIKPDHLALLPDQVGACSWEDGCGAPRVNLQEEDVNQEEEAALEGQEAVTELEEVASNLDTEIQTGGSDMSEIIDRILADGRLAYNAEQLEEMGEEALEAIADTLEALPVPQTNAEEEEAHEEADGAEEQDEPAVNAEELESLRELARAINDLGGVESLRAVVTDFAANARARHDALVSQLVANELCTLSREQLERMEEDQLVSLRQAFQTVDYAGMGAVRGAEGEVELEMPALNWDES